MAKDSNHHFRPISQGSKALGPKDFLVGDLYHRSFVSVIREKLANSHDDRGFHYDPFKLFWQPPGTEDDIRVHGEMYTSPAFLEAHRELQESPGEPGCNFPRVVVAMMFWSDVTHLTSFGNAKLWPTYLCFGNESKYRRCKPNCHLCNHVAYFQAVSCLLFLPFIPFSDNSLQLLDSFKDFASKHMGSKRPSNSFMPHCRCESLHAQWDILLDEEFLVAYQHGIVIECCDGVMRRFYPCILTYSADYKEKHAGFICCFTTDFLTNLCRIIIASIRDLGSCPCPRCLIPFSLVPDMGTANDMKLRKSLARVDNEERRHKVQMARQLIYNKRYVVNSKVVEGILKKESLVPTTVSCALAEADKN